MAVLAQHRQGEKPKEIDSIGKKTQLITYLASGQKMTVTLRRTATCSHRTRSHIEQFKMRCWFKLFCSAPS